MIYVRDVSLTKFCLVRVTEAKLESRIFYSLSATVLTTEQFKALKSNLLLSVILIPQVKLIIIVPRAPSLYGYLIIITNYANKLYVEKFSLSLLTPPPVPLFHRPKSLSN